MKARSPNVEASAIADLQQTIAKLQRQLDERTAELNEKNERYTLVSQAVAEGIYDWDIEQNILFVSPRLMEIFGFDGAGLNSEDWFDLVHAADREAYRTGIQDCFKNATPKVNCEYRILVQNGEYRWVEDHGLPVRNAAGRAIRLVGAVNDITARKETDLALREALEQQTATAEILTVISNSLTDTQPVFEAIVQSGLRLFPHAAISVVLAMNDEAHLVAVAETDPARAEAWRRKFPFPLTREYIHSAAILDQQVINIPDVRDAPPGFGAGRQNFLVSGYRGITIVPMQRGDAAIGVLSVVRPAPGPLSVEQLAVLKTFANQAVIAIENARLITETREALEQQTATAEVLQVINSSPGDLAPVFDAILEKANYLCETAFGVLWTFDGTHYLPGAIHGPQAFIDAIKDKPRPPANGGTLYRHAAGEQLVHIEDMASETEVYGTNSTRRVFVDLGGGRSALSVALQKDGALFGALQVYRQEVRPFSDKQIALLQNFAAQAVIAMENARLLTETRERTVELQEALEYQTATSDVLNFISRSTFDLTPVLEHVIETAIRLCRAHMGSVFRLEDGVYRWAAGCGLEPSYREIEMRTPISPGTGTLVGRVALEGRTVQIADADADPQYAVKDEARITRAHTMLGVPLLRDGAPIGVIAMARDRVELFNDKEIALVSTFADQAVIAIENVRLITETQGARDDAEEALHDLKAAQANLIQAEKMASLGQLTAGIAHEIKNPLNFVNNFAILSVELLDELKETAAPALATLNEDKRADVDDTMELLTGNLEKIAEHGKRADNIVKSMLEHSRGVSGERREVDLNGVIEEALNLAYHGARAQDQTFNISLERDYASTLKPIELAPQEMTRVFLNLFGNGFYAATKRARETGYGSFQPSLTVATREEDNMAEVRVRDNGAGIPPEIKDKLFQPFFTTKPTGEGTGLGLSISYDIVTQQHGGTITVESEPGSFTEFTVRLPRRQQAPQHMEPV